MKNFVQLSQNH